MEHDSTYRAGTYIGWVGHKNLGDEAMWEVCRKQFPQIRWFAHKRIGESFRRAFSRARHEVSSLGSVGDRNEQRIQRRSVETGLLGGGTLINRNETYLNSYRLLRRRTGRPVPVFGSGVASTEIWSALSGWSDRRREWVELVSELPVVGVRGPLSQSALEAAGARNVTISGDPAVMFHTPLPPATESSEPKRCLRIGVNCGHARSLLWGSNAQIHESLACVVEQLARAGHTVELLSVWRHDTHYCRDIARRAGLSRAAVAPLLVSPRKFMERMKTLDLVVALKLHTGVMAAAANVPFVMLEYRPKCLDFALTLDWERFTIRTSELSANKLMETILRLSSEIPSARAELCRKMCELSSRFESYCRRIEPLLMSA
ncbi:MAG: polysaccharide pyruvyl transferase family protein [Terriglobales bacterium]